LVKIYLYDNIALINFDQASTILIANLSRRNKRLDCGPVCKLVEWLSAASSKRCSK